MSCSYQPPALPPPLVLEERPEDDEEEADEPLDLLLLDPHELVNALARFASRSIASRARSMRRRSSRMRAASRSIAYAADCIDDDCGGTTS
jgi:hypothetical protein